MFSKKLFTICGVFVLAVFLFTACSGGGGGGSTPVSTPPITSSSDPFCKARETKDVDFSVLNNVVSIIQRESVFRDIASDEERLMRGALDRVFAFLATSTPSWARDIVEQEITRANTFNDSPDFSVLNNVFNELAKDPRYRDLNDPDQKEALLKASVEGIIETLEDPFASYATAEEYALGRLNFSGTYRGMGVSLGRNFKSEITIDRVERGSAAEKGGLETGDVIIAVDGKSTAKCTVNQFIIEIKTRSNPKLEMKIRRNNEEKDITVTMEDIKPRDVISCPGFELPDKRGISTQDLAYACPFLDRDGNPVTDIAYIKIKHFTSPAHEDFTKILKNLDQENLKGIIIDLRDNPGGGLREIREEVDYFLQGPKTILIERSEFRNNTPSGVTTIHTSNKIDLVDPALTVVILVNQNSFSGAELFPAALRDNGRAVIISRDERTGGKGTINRVFELNGGKDGALYIAVAIYLTPNGDMVEKLDLDKDGYFEIGGIMPDIKVDWTSRDFIENGRNPNWDPTLFEAIEFIRGE